MGQELAARFHARFKLFGWLAVDEKFSTVDGSGRVRILLNGEELADYPGFANQTPIKNYLIGIGKANASGIITLGPCEVLVLAELIGLQGTSSWDFQDDVMLISFQ